MFFLNFRKGQFCRSRNKHALCFRLPCVVVILVVKMIKQVDNSWVFVVVWPLWFVCAHGRLAAGKSRPADVPICYLTDVTLRWLVAYDFPPSDTKGKRVCLVLNWGVRFRSCLFIYSTVRRSTWSCCAAFPSGYLFDFSVEKRCPVKACLRVIGYNTKFPIGFIKRYLFW